MPRAHPELHTLVRSALFLNSWAWVVPRALSAASKAASARAGHPGVAPLKGCVISSKPML